MARTSQTQTKTSDQFFFIGLQTFRKGSILMSLIASILFFPLLAIVSLGKLFTWLLIDFWWLLIIIYIWAHQKHNK